MIHAAELRPTDTVLEIGPGTGVLTFELAKKAKRVVAVEKDDKLAKSLSEKLNVLDITNVKVINQDILKPPIDFANQYIDLRSHYKVVSNIPYYLTSRLIKNLLEQNPKPETIMLTVQKEVAQRITCRPPKMNLLGLSVQIFGKPEIVKIVPAECFWPKPKVNSAIIKISSVSEDFFKENKLDKNLFFEVVRLGFSKKRKQLAAVLSEKYSKEKVLETMNYLKINPRSRAENLSREEWSELISLLGNPISE